MNREIWGKPFLFLEFTPTTRGTSKIPEEVSIRRLHGLATKTTLGSGQARQLAKPGSLDLASFGQLFRTLGLEYFIKNPGDQGHSMRRLKKGTKRAWKSSERSKLYVRIHVQHGIEELNLHVIRELRRHTE
ncbi:hypothetical protein PIB30_078879 [Stylosanthes scabra]|uniref:Uncharacterized protein n=1 Tax=Stylosanthes scabra TaxID=79078 RepID=A0ABU6WPB0_9FABA|nr:hypothetical protein [Stylosanthes scabra]